MIKKEKCNKCKPGYIFKNEDIGIYWCDNATCDNTGRYKTEKELKSEQKKRESTRKYQKAYIKRKRDERG